MEPHNEDIKEWKPGQLVQGDRWNKENKSKKDLN
jgi:hypothetical protein